MKIQANYRGYVVRRDKWDTQPDKHKEAITDDDNVSLHLLSVIVGYGWEFHGHQTLFARIKSIFMKRNMVFSAVPL